VVALANPGLAKQGEPSTIAAIKNGGLKQLA